MPRCQSESPLLPQSPCAMELMGMHADHRRREYHYGDRCGYWSLPVQCVLSLALLCLL